MAYLRMARAAPVPLLFLLLSCAPLSASAHTLRTNGSIEGVMHVSPDHLPTAGESAAFRFILRDSARRLDAANYHLALSVVDARGIATTVPLTAGGMTAKALYVFPHAGDYVAILTGSSTAQGIPSFKLVYDDIGVLPPGQHQNPVAELFGEHGGHLLATGLIVLMFLGVVVWEKLAERRHTYSGNKNP